MKPSRWVLSLGLVLGALSAEAVPIKTSDGATVDVEFAALKATFEAQLRSKGLEYDALDIVNNSAIVHRPRIRIRDTAYRIAFNRETSHGYCRLFGYGNQTGLTTDYGDSAGKAAWVNADGDYVQLATASYIVEELSCRTH